MRAIPTQGESMFLQANLELQDLKAAVDRITPLVLRLSDVDHPRHGLRIERPDRVELVPGQGLRIVATVHLDWTVAGVHVPITATSAEVLLIPAVVLKDGHQELQFSFQLEAIDLRHVPDILDESIIERVNKGLEADDSKLSWNFLETLTFGFDMPARLESVNKITLAAQQGMVRITAEGFYLAVSYQADVARAPIAETEPLEPLEKKGKSAPALAA
jgi:hypothetical protein